VTSSLVHDNTWLIAHSMPIIELHELFQYAKEIAQLEGEQPHYLVCTTLGTHVLPKEFHTDGVSLTNIFPVSSLFSQCKKIFTACGYNIMNETIGYTNKHHFIPFPRRYDDQFLRAKHRRRVI